MRLVPGVFLVVALLVALGCERKPAADIVVEVAEDGRLLVAPAGRGRDADTAATQTGLRHVKSGVGGRKLSMAELGKLLRDKALAAPRDPDGLPAFSVEISAHPECLYQDVQKVMTECSDNYVWRVIWKMGNKRLDANLPKDSGNYIVDEEFVANPPLSFREPPNAAYGVGRRAELARSRTRATRQLRVMLCWVNENGQVIHSPSEPLPDDRPSLREPVSTAGGHTSRSGSRRWRSVARKMSK